MIQKLWLSLGFIFLLIGIIGIFLPLLPTTPFLLITAFCFSKGSDYWHQWLLNHAWFGPPVRDWIKHRMIRTRVKFISVTMILLGIPSVIYFSPNHVISFLILLVMLTAIIYILTRPSESKNSTFLDDK